MESSVGIDVSVAGRVNGEVLPADGGIMLAYSHLKTQLT
jgi:hypothetical protein